MQYLGIYTNDLCNNTNLAEHLKADTIEELEAKPTKKLYLKVYAMHNDILEEAELICTKIMN